MKQITVSEQEIARQNTVMDQVALSLAGNAPVFYIQTFGCQQNEADSERLAGMAQRMGYTVSDDPSQADLILVNTCAIREHAELKTLSVTGQFKHLKEKKPSLLIGMCGCMVSQEHRRDDVKYKYPYVDFIFGTEHLYRFPEILAEALSRSGRHFYPNEGDGNIAEGLPVRRESTFQAWVSIMYGCNNFCTYCIVPYVRGRERSRRPEDILSEVEQLVRDGYREITLLGQNVNSYGRDADFDCDFADLLDRVCRVSGDFTVRFMTSHPKDASRKLIDTIARNPKIARQFHLPLQSGSDRILAAMNRRYTTEKYLETVDYLREKVPGIAITTDIIVGFPGETEEDFAGTLAMLRRVRYDNIYSFQYSPRRNTPAASMENQIPPSVKKERFARLLATQTEISRACNETYVGKIVSVLVEGRSKTDQSRLTGRTEGNRLVHFEGDDALIGTVTRVRVTHADTYALLGETVPSDN